MAAEPAIVSDGAAVTEAAGTALGARLTTGDIVLVSGEMGSGKTTLIRGICRALGYDGPVTSPSFALVNRYAGDVEIAHLDLQRLSGLGGEDGGIAEDHLDERLVALIEWPEAALPVLPRPARARVRLEHGRVPGERLLTIELEDRDRC